MNTDTLRQLISNAENGKPELTEAVLSIPGFSSPKVRRLLNALCSQPDANYLEIGVHVGSTFIPAVYNNAARATCIDRWQMFEGAREKFREHVALYLAGREVTIIDHECFTVDLSLIPANVSVYFYDGDHTTEAQYKAVTYFAPVLADQFVIVVDDCNWEEPREETKHALKDLGYTVEYDVLLPGKYNGDRIGWWNGLYVALVSKAINEP